MASQQNDLTSQHKELTGQDNYLISGSRNMPPYNRVLSNKCTKNLETLHKLKFNLDLKGF